MRFKVGDKVIPDYKTAEEMPGCVRRMKESSGMVLTVKEALTNEVGLYYRLSDDWWWPAKAVSMFNKPLETLADLEAMYAQF